MSVLFLQVRKHRSLISNALKGIRVTLSIPNNRKRNVLETAQKTLTLLTSNHSTTCTEGRGLTMPRQSVCKLAKYSLDEKSLAITVHWHDGSQSSFPFIFLRDNCQCPLCVHKSSQQRLLDTPRTVDLNIQPTGVEIGHDGTCLTLVWEDKHRSDFSTDWLHYRIFPATKPDAKPRNVAGLKHVFWDNNMEGNISRFDFAHILEDGKVIYSWLETLATSGIALVTNTPTQSGQLQRIARNVGGYTRFSNYGEIFTVKNKADPSNLAYTMGDLPLHTDLPYFDYQPGIQLLHCIEQSNKGGTNLLVDGFHIAQTMRDRFPDDFKVLTEVKVAFFDRGFDAFGEYMQEAERFIIQLNNYGIVEAIAHNDCVRDSFINAPSDDVRKFYKAYYIFTRLINDPTNTVRHKLNPGDILTIHNRRVLHGRTAYDASKESRWLEGAYLDWDQALSTMRVLARKHNIAISG